MISEHKFLDEPYSVDLESLRLNCRLIAIKQKLQYVNELNLETENGKYSGFINTEGKPHVWGIFSK